MNSTEPTSMQWRKSSHSNGQANCIEVATMHGHQLGVAVRDSKATGNVCLTFPARAWRQLIDRLKDNVMR